jgi:hypothetical protein
MAKQTPSAFDLLADLWFSYRSRSFLPPQEPFMTPSSIPRYGRTLKNLALVCLFSGFALELGGAITDNRILFRTGIYFFLLGIPLLFLGIFLGRRKP